MSFMCASTRDEIESELPPSLHHSSSMARTEAATSLPAATSREPRRAESRPHSKSWFTDRESASSPDCGENFGRLVYLRIQAGHTLFVSLHRFFSITSFVVSRRGKLLESE